MNIVQLQDQLKNFSQDQLIREMQMPSGNAPQFLVLGEIMRRQRMEQDFMAQQAKGDQGTVAQEAVAAAGVPQGGIATMAQALAPQTDMTQNTGIAPVQAMASGGPVKKMAEGDIVVRNGRRYIEQEDGTLIDEETGERARTTRRGAETFMEDWMQPEVLTPPRVGSPTSPELPPNTTAFGALPSLLRDSMMSRAEASRGAPALGPVSTAGAAPSMGMAPPPSAATLRMMGFEPNDEDSRFRSVNPSYSEGRPDVFPPYLDPPIPLPDTRGTPIYEDRSAMIRRGGVPDYMPPTDFITAERQAEAERLMGFEPPEKPYDPFEVYAQLPAYKEARERDAERRERLAADRAARDMPEALPQTEGAPLSLDDAAKAAEEAKGIRGAAAAVSARTSSGGGAGGAGGAGGMSSYEQELLNVLARREKAEKQDKWLALAQVGLNMMSSTNPTLLGAIGEAGVKGVEGVRAARDQYDKDKLDILGALEQSRMARAAAAARAARSAGGSALKPLPVGALDIYDSQIEAISDALFDGTAQLAPAQRLELQAELDRLQGEKARLQGAFLSQYGYSAGGASPAASSGVYSMDDVSE